LSPPPPRKENDMKDTAVIDSNLSTLQWALNKQKELFNQEKGKRDALVKIRQEMKLEFESKQNYLETLGQVNVLLQKTSEYQRRMACAQIEELGTFALQYIFGSNFKLEIDLTPKPEAEIYVVSTGEDGFVKVKPQDSRGGGIVDIVSLALRIVMLQAWEPFIDGPVILDEPGKHVSSEHIQAVANFLLEVGNKFNRQVIAVTHNEQLASAADHHLTVKLVNHKSKVTVEKGGLSNA